MREVVDRVRTRLLPALVTALGVTLVAAGLLNLNGPVDAGGTAVVSPTTPPILTPEPTATPSDRPSGSSGPASSSPDASGTPDASATADASARVSTRVVVPALGIDLPVVKPPGGASTYPLCDVAMYIQQLSQPGLPGATYLYAHAREGMFLPLLTASQVNDGAAMIGMLVEVYTSDDRLFLYEITEVRRHQLTLDDAVAATTSQLWLQTSEGPKGTPQKLQVIAQPLSDGPADDAAAHPTPHPVVCG
jgi:hypothetical protein